MNYNYRMDSMNNNSSIIDNIPQLPQPISNDIINAMNNL